MLTHSFQLKVTIHLPMENKNKQKKNSKADFFIYLFIFLASPLRKLRLTGIKRMNEDHISLMFFNLIISITVIDSRKQSKQKYAYLHR